MATKKAKFYAPPYTPETAGAIMSTKLPVASPKDNLADIADRLVNQEFDSIDTVYVVGHSQALEGLIDMRQVAGRQPSALAGDLASKPPVTLRPQADQEKVVYEAIKHDTVAIPVVDKQGSFLGAVTAHTLVDVLHQEHLEDAMITAGVRSSHGAGVFGGRLKLLVRARAPWLVIGLLAGLLLSFITSWFEASLQESIAIAYFIPVVAYVAGSVGAQSGAIAVRALALLKINYLRYLLKELSIGLILGVIVGAVGLTGAWLIAGSWDIALAVGLALALAGVMAAVLAAVIPFIFGLFDKDPALGSGPIATATLDVISVVAYFLIVQAVV